MKMERRIGCDALAGITILLCGPNAVAAQALIAAAGPVPPGLEIGHSLTCGLRSEHFEWRPGAT
jgi:hypothetical protein